MFANTRSEVQQQQWSHPPRLHSKQTQTTQSRWFATQKRPRYNALLTPTVVHIIWNCAATWKQNNLGEHSRKLALERARLLSRFCQPSSLQRGRFRLANNSHLWMGRGKRVHNEQRDAGISTNALARTWHARSARCQGTLHTDNIRTHLRREVIARGIRYRTPVPFRRTVLPYAAFFALQTTELDSAKTSVFETAAARACRSCLVSGVDKSSQVNNKAKRWHRCHLKIVIHVSVDPQHLRKRRNFKDQIGPVKNT